MKKRSTISLLTFLVLSIFVHLATIGVLHFTAKNQSLGIKDKDTIEFEITDLGREQKMQLIEQDERRANDETPEEARFMGRHNQSVVKETRAKNHGDFTNAAGGGPTQKKTLSQNQKPPPQKGKTKQEDGTLPSLSALNPKFDFSPSRRHEALAQETPSGGPQSATNDYLKDVDVSIETMLNSREFVYYSYYQRIRSQIRQHWEPSIRAKVRSIFAQGRSIASTKDHVTRVIIVLNKQGELIKVQVVGQSGVKDLDDAAVEAFRAAQPFPNPPKGIVDNDGTIKINWDFILEA